MSLTAGTEEQKFEQGKKNLDSQEMFPTLQEKIIAGIPSGRQQHKVLKMDQPR